MNKPIRYRVEGAKMNPDLASVCITFVRDETGDLVKYEDYARLKAEVERLRASSFVTAVPVEQYERVIKAGDAMAAHILKIEEEVYEVTPCGSYYVIAEWNAAKEGKQP